MNQVAETLNIVYNIGLNAYSLYADCYNGPSVKSALVTRYQFDMMHVLGHFPTTPPKYYQVCFFSIFKNIFLQSR